MAEPGAADRAARHLAAALSAAGAEAAALGRRLIALGLTERAVTACFGVRCAAHAALRVAGAAPPGPLPPAAVLPWLLAAGRPVPRAAAAHRLGADLDALLALGIVAADGDAIAPRLLLLPAGPSLVACSLDRPGGGGRPDDSSYHLLGALPGRRVDRWLDIGTGNAFVPLAAPAQAARILGTDIDPAALDLGRAGAALSGTPHLDLATADLLSGEGWSLITFNAPWPDPAPLLERFWAELPAHLAAGGEAVVHAEHLPALYPCTGQVVAARYTPAGVEPAFAVARWRPGPARAPVVVEVELRADRPHVRRGDLDPDG
jgi:hypothetical protein